MISTLKSKLADRLRHDLDIEYTHDIPSYILAPISNTVDVWAWMNKYIPLIYIDENSYSCPYTDCGETTLY